MPAGKLQRMTIIESITYLIYELACSKDHISNVRQTQKWLHGLYDPLLDRTPDLSSNIRSKDSVSGCVARTSSSPKNVVLFLS